jgi:CheY-like chemotaxis protein
LCEARERADVDKFSQSFGKTAQGLSKNPLGIIALFIVLVYGFASLVAVFSGSLNANERLPIIWFLVVFPVLVLAVFSWLVSQHAGKLYGPSDYKNEENYVAIVASLAAATVRRSNAESAPAPEDFRRIAKLVSDSSPLHFAKSDSWQTHILWVDDRPDDNAYEREAFEAVGIRFTLALSTDQALDILSRDRFAAIISDMGRREGSREGYLLLDTIRTQGNQIPFFIYSSSNLTEHKHEITQHGGQGTTNHPQELFQMVTGEIVKRLNK